MKRVPKTIAASAVLSAVLIAAVPAAAQPEAAQNIQIVRTRDLDLATPNGRARLNHRLATAASEVCGTAEDFDVAGRIEVKQCRLDVLARARAKVETLTSSRAMAGP